MTDKNWEGTIPRFSRTTRQPELAQVLKQVEIVCHYVLLKFFRKTMFNKTILNSVFVKSGIRSR